MLSGKAWKYDLLLVVSLVMSFRSRQLSTIPAYNRQQNLSGRFPKQSRIGFSCTQFITQPAMWGVVLYLCMDI